MQSMYAICGLNCGKCPAYLAYLNDDRELREKTAEAWSVQFQMKFLPKDVNCSGCTTAGKVKIGHCSVCEVRLCGLEKKVENCAPCPEYGCEKLNVLFGFIPEAKSNLEEIRRQSQGGRR